MDKTYIAKVTQRTPRPRSKRLRQQGIGSTASTTVVMSGASGGSIVPAGDGHSHSNLSALNEISTDQNGYEYLTQLRETENPDTGETTVERVTEKVKAGFADDAAHATEADHAREADNADKWDGLQAADYLDQSVRKADNVEFAKVAAPVAQSPDFQQGINTGRGWQIGASGGAELDSLTLRRFLEVPELRYNRTSVEVGNKWNAPGGGLIESVVVDKDADGNELMTGTVTLHLEDGEQGAVAADDICMGVFHSLTSGMNSEESSDDSRGNFKFKGFFTTYFRITEILNADSSVFKYTLRGVSDRWTETKHPCASMTFVGYGNFTDAARQTSRYSTRSYERFLRDVNDWEISESMIAAQFGDLSNLSIHGLKQMTGYSAYLNNIYMSGTVEQFERLPYRLVIDTAGSDTLAYGESLNVTCSVWKGWDDVTGKVQSWKIVRDSGDPTEDEAWDNSSKAQSFAGTISIDHYKNYSDLGEIGVSTLFTITVYMNDGESTDYTLAI